MYNNYNVTQRPVKWRNVDIMENELFTGAGDRARLESAFSHTYFTVYVIRRHRACGEDDKWLVIVVDK